MNASAQHAAALQARHAAHARGTPGGRRGAPPPPTTAAGVVHASVDALAHVAAAPSSLFGSFARAGHALSSVLARRPVTVPAPAPAAAPRVRAQHVAGWFDHITELVTEGRRLGEVPSDGAGFHVPAGSSPAWIYDVDWPAAAAWVHRASKVVLARVEHAHAHVERHGRLPHGELAEEHKTGVAWLDLNAPPTRLGDALRHLHDWIHDRSHDAERAARTRDAPRATDSSHGDAWEDAVANRDLVGAAVRHLEHTNAHERSRSRRLADGFLGAASTLPVTGVYAIRSSFGSYPANGGSDVFNGLLRYLFYDTLYAAPAIPFLLSRAHPPLFLQAVLPLQPAERGRRRVWRRHRPHVLPRKYACCVSGRMCALAHCFSPRSSLGAAAHVQVSRVAGAARRLPLGDARVRHRVQHGQRRRARHAGPADDAHGDAVGIILRIAEGADAIANLIRTGDTELTGEERGQAVVCAIAQLGGLIFSVFATTIALLACICAPIGASIAVCLYRIVWGQSRRAAARRKALQGFQQSITRLRRRRRVGSQSTGAGAASGTASASEASVPVLSQRRRVLGLDVGRQLRFGFERLPGEPEAEADGKSGAVGLT